VAVGDYYFAKATRLIAELGNPDVTRTVAAALEAICGAQIDDFELRGSYPGNEAAYLQVVKGKTAALIAAACVAGAQLSGAPRRVVDALGRYGELLGIAFQMADDLVDFSQRSGKPLGQDIRERVLSLPLIYATEHPELGPQLRALLDAGVADDELPRVVSLVQESGALHRVLAHAKDLAATAVRELDAVGLDGASGHLADLAAAAVDRTG
jgi:geranylgeranyl pyrophosphate synthase